MNKQEPMTAFLEDVTPFFRGRLVSYADVGANVGNTYKAVAKSGLSVDRALLIEANKNVFERLEVALGDNLNLPNVRCLNLAASAVAGTLRMHDMNDMSTVVSATEAEDFEGDLSPLKDGFLEVESKPFDELIEFFPEKNVSILKIDVEGHELAVLKGAEKALADHRIDVVYVEAAVIPGIAGQTYIRDIEDVMATFGYSVFKFYEQAHDWVKDRPVLRRVNVAFFSPEMIDRYPLSLMQSMAKLESELHQARNEIEQQKKEYEGTLQDRFAEIAQLTKLVSEQGSLGRSEHEQLVVPQSHSKAPGSKFHRAAQRKFGMKPNQVNALICVLIYFMGIATPLVF